MADDSPSREDAHAALTALCAGAYGPKGGRKDYLFHLSSYHARVLMDLFGNLEAKCRQNRLEFDPTPAAPDPQPVCECKSCRAKRAYGYALGCCPEWLSHGAACICGGTFRAAPDQAEGPDESRGDDVPSVTSRAEESVMDKGVFRYDTDKTRLGAPLVPWDPSHREIL